ncbi:piggyBac transposable element-derived protein 3-like, partial [Rhagoletis pomonella]|uniref:piggyBac transposable element-derived protein 3-like n=1 Tax=Rhagoletis pomonella TaxID=28610 RepID=UPI00177E2B55
MQNYNIRFERGISLHEVLAILEEDDTNETRVEEVCIFPPNNATGDLTDEDSGDEDYMQMDNLPASQLQAPAEVVFERKNDESTSSEDSDDDLPLSLLQKQENVRKCNVKRQKKYNWVKEDLAVIATDFEDSEVLVNTENPLELFSKFFDDEVIELILSESNKYAQQKNVNAILEKREILAFIGVLILSGYIQVPRRKMFWEREKDCHNDLVSEAISRDRFDLIFSNFHVCDNQHLNIDDKFAKVRPLFRLLNKKFMENSPVEEMHSVDEAMVPYYGRHGCKQYIHGKPIRYGYKLWVGATRLGYLNWFEPYQGASTNISKDYADFGVGGGVVLEYAQALRAKWPNRNFHLFFDNFFSSIPLIEKLTEWNLYSTGTIRENRLKDISLTDSKHMKKDKRGKYDYAKISDQNIIAVKWHDNNMVCLISNFAGLAPIHAVKRYSRQQKKNIQVEQPHLINMYNANMGGVDRSDQNISLYRISIRGKKWYNCLLGHCIDMAIQNAWQLQRKQGGNLDQLKFRRFLQKKVRTGKITKQQKSKLLELMRANTRVASGQFVGVSGAKNSQQVWDMVRGELNACGGACKTAEQWKKCWSDWKVAVKKQQSAYNRFKNLTGNRPASEGPKPCEGLDAEVLELFPAAVLDGDGKTIEAGVHEENVDETLEDEYLAEYLIEDE